MRIIQAQEIARTVAGLCVRANVRLPDDVKTTIDAFAKKEPWPAAKDVMHSMAENWELAERERLPICQDTGLACVFLEVGNEVHIEGDVAAAVDEGVRRGYQEGYLRGSAVRDPLERVNTGDNTPAMLYYEPVLGDRLHITVCPKGFGSENMSRIKMLRPSDGVEGVADFVVETVLLAGGNPCPPIIVGVGLGGTFDKAALLAKKALLRELGTAHESPFYASLEAELLKRVNALGIGPGGLGGATTALAVHIKSMPTHIAGLPCAVNINCHVARHASEVL